MSAELLPIDKKCLLCCAAGALAVYSAFAARESQTISFASVLHAASKLCAARLPFAAFFDSLFELTEQHAAQSDYVGFVRRLAAERRGSPSASHASAYETEPESISRLVSGNLG